MGQPKVSVSLITYNHEKYIVECLDSIIKQVVDFEIEVVVADDCSTDRTPEIVAEYALKYPTLIKPILRKANLGMVQNALATIKACSGDYISLMEGDDFWVNDHKLQIQADYLDKNKDCALCFTNGYIFFDETPGKRQSFYEESKKPPQKFDRDFFIKKACNILNNTKMFRNEVQPEIFPDWIYNSINWDWVLHILQSANGNFGFIDIETMAYRRHSGAAFMTKSEIDILQNGIVTLHELNKYLDYIFNETFKNLWWEHRELSFEHIRKGNWTKFLYYYCKYRFAPGKTNEFTFKDDVWRLKSALKDRENNVSKKIYSN